MKSKNNKQLTKSAKLICCKLKLQSLGYVLSVTHRHTTQDLEGKIYTGRECMLHLNPGKTLEAHLSRDRFVS
eukprot:5088772-Amphidinium_carterae.1